MAVTPTSFWEDYLPLSSGTLATVTGLGIVTNIVVCNEDTVARTFTILVNGKSLCPAVAIDPNTVQVIDMRKVVTTGKIISGSASTASKVTAHISGTVTT